MRVATVIITAIAVLKILTVIDSSCPASLDLVECIALLF